MRENKFIADRKLNFAVSCASGVESVLKKEIDRLGYGENPADNGLIKFSADSLAVSRLNLSLRTAEKVYIVVGEFNATTFDMIYDGVKSLPWEDYVTESGTVTVDGKCVKSAIYAISDCQRIINKAICDRLCEKYKLNKLSFNGERYQVFFSLYKDKLTVMLNTSGAGLHKRGYRELVGIAPIKETLASAMLLMSDFYYKRPFLDPFCGSGTFVIEGAFIALDIAPNLNRRFDFNFWKNYDESLFIEAFTECRDKEHRDRKLEFFGSDIDQKAIKLSNFHAERAGIKDYVKFSRCDVKNLKLPSDFGTIVTNPPYGERVFDRSEAESCYKNLSECLLNNDGWSLFLITSAKNFEKIYGRKADKTRKLYNSNKECNYYYYYGKRREK